MSKCKYSDEESITDPNKYNGLITKIWGPSLWISLHSISFGYPINPTEQDKLNYKNFFISLANVLPCSYCKDSYLKFISTDCTKLTDDVLKSRHTLSKWVYYLHEQVNKKLGVSYGVTYNDVKNKYESFRAKCSHNTNANGCIIPLQKTNDAYLLIKYKDAPVIPIDLADKFINYAKLRNISQEYFNDYDIIKNYYYLNKNSNVWKARNNYCIELIDYMRIKGKLCLEIDGKFKGLPTILELYLILKFCSNLSLEDLTNMSQTLTFLS